MTESTNAQLAADLRLINVRLLTSLSQEQITLLELAAQRLEGEISEAWQPIETAPKDGTDILVWRPDEGDGGFDAHAGVDYWNKGTWRHSRRDQQPTHWQPLPSRPKAAAREA